MRRWKCREVIEVLNNIVDLADEIEYLQSLGIKEALEEVPLISLTCLQREEVDFETLNNNFMVCHGLFYFPNFSVQK